MGKEHRQQELTCRQPRHQDWLMHTGEEIKGETNLKQQALLPYTRYMRPLRMWEKIEQGIAGVAGLGHNPSPLVCIASSRTTRAMH